MNADNEVTSHRSEILTGSEISHQFEFTSGLMQTSSYIDAYNIVERIVKSNNKTPFHRKILFFFW